MPDQTRVRNVSVYGDLDVPALGMVIPYRHEAVIDADIAASLVASGNFVTVNRSTDTGSDTSADTAPDPTPPDPAPAPADDTATTSTTADHEEQNQRRRSSIPSSD